MAIPSALKGVLGRFLLGAYIFLVSPYLYAESPSECLGPLLEARVSECEGPRCEDRDFIMAILDLADLRPGVVLSQKAVEEGKNRVLQTGLFSKVEVLCLAKEDLERKGIVAEMHLEAISRIREIRFIGLRHFDPDDIFPSLPVGPGDPIEPETSRGEEVLERVKEAVLRLYREEGFWDTRVECALKRVEKSLVDVEVRVREGQRTKVASVEVRLMPLRFEAGSGVPGEWTCPEVKPRDLKKFTGVSSGDPYTEETIPRAIQNLQRALRALGFAGVKVEGEFLEDKTLRISATYTSCWLLRFYIRDTEQKGRLGFKPYVDEELLEALPFADSGVFDLAEASLGREQVRQFFEDRGYLFVSVTLDYREKGTSPDPLGPNVAGVISYFITTNYQSRISRIVFRGAQKISPSRLLEVMATKVYDFFGDPGAVLPDQVFMDLERIEALYRREGFRGMRFRPTVPLPEGQEALQGKNLRRRFISKVGREVVYTFVENDKLFSVRTLPSTHSVTLEIGIEEGEQDLVGRVGLEGLRAFRPEDVLEEIGLRPGTPFSKERVEEALRVLSRRYKNEGYLGAKFEVRCEGHEPSVEEGQCDVNEVSARRVDLKIRVEEGVRSEVAIVVPVGLKRTNEYVVLREFPKPKEPYRANRVAEAVRALKNLGIFESVQVKVVGSGEERPRERVVLVVECREAKTKFVDISAGFETINRSGEFPKTLASSLATEVALQDTRTVGFGRVAGLEIPDILLTAEVRYSDLNFLGRAKRVYLPIKYGLSATAWDRYASFTPTYVDPRFILRGLSLRVTPFLIYDRAFTRLDLFEVGLETSLSKEVLPRLFASLAYEVAEVASRDPETEAHYSPFRLENKVMPVLTFDRLDHPLNPKRGGLLQASLSYINALVGGEVKNFLKFETVAKGFYTIRNFLTIGVMGRYGTSRSFGASGLLPQDERFTLGGNRGMRGFGNDAISQYNPDGTLRLLRREDGTYYKPYGGDVVIASSLEVRFPVVRRINLYGAAFYDMGALADRVSEVSWKSFRHSAGVGLRFLIGDSIPLRLDYGLILDRRCRDVDPKTGECILKEEVGNIHFGLLYTF